MDPDSREISGAEVVRDAVCGCARFIAGNLKGISVEEAEEKAGLLHHHYPCMASMKKLREFNMDTLMHNSGHIVRKNVAEQVKPFKQLKYLKPGNLAE